MNPLDMTGPEFLRFYLAWGLAGLLLVGMLRTFWLDKQDISFGVRRWAPGDYPQESEAYTIALLRGGEKEAVSALLGRLLSAGILTLEGAEIRRIHDGARELHLLPIEKSALDALGLSGPVAQAEPTLLLHLEPQLREMRQDLEEQGLLSSPTLRRPWNTLRNIALLAVPGMGVAKLAVAIGRGKTNIGFLAILILVYAVATLLLLRPPRLTLAGRRYLKWLRESHQGLVRQISTGATQGGGEIAMAAGIFGLTALPALHGDLDPRRWRAGAEPGGGSGGGGGSGDSDGGDGGGGDGGGGGCGGCGGGGD